MANNKHNVTITNTMLVYPKSHPPTKLLQLSNLDRKCPALLYMVLFYTNNPRKQQLIEGLKKGLEETLSVWYPAAGRLMCREPGEKSWRLDIIACNDKNNDNQSGGGVIFADAVTKAHISELGDISQDNQSFLKKLVFRPPTTTVSSFTDDGISEMPLVVAQVTEFGCGGYAIGVGISHSVFDGHGQFKFLSAWASKVAGREEDDGKLELVEPVHERERLIVNVGKNCRLSSTSNVVAFTHLHQLIKQAAVVTSDIEKEDFVLKTITISNEKIEKLKRKITTACTSFEAVAAHLWKARTKAVRLPKDRSVCLQFSVDTRTRLSPPLPSSFTGNAYVLSSISSTCGDLLQKETLSSIVHKIKAAKDSVNNDYIHAYLLALDGPHDESSLPALPELTSVSDWRRTPYHKLDFGDGETMWAVPLASPLQEVVYFMQSPREVGGIDVRIGLMRSHVVDFVNYFLDVY